MSGTSRVARKAVRVQKGQISHGRSSRGSSRGRSPAITPATGQALPPAGPSGSLPSMALRPQSAARKRKSSAMFVDESQGGLGPAVGIRDSATPQSGAALGGRSSVGSRASAASAGRGATPVALAATGGAGASDSDEGGDDYGDDDFEDYSGDGFEDEDDAAGGPVKVGSAVPAALKRSPSAQRRQMEGASLPVGHGGIVAPAGGHSERVHARGGGQSFHAVKHRAAPGVVEDFDDAAGLGGDEAEAGGSDRLSSILAAAVADHPDAGGASSHAGGKEVERVQREAARARRERARAGQANPRASRVAALRSAGQLRLSQGRSALFAMAPQSKQQLVERAVQQGGRVHSVTQTFDDAADDGCQTEAVPSRDGTSQAPEDPQLHAAWRQLDRSSTVSSTRPTTEQSLGAGPELTASAALLATRQSAVLGAFLRRVGRTVETVLAESAARAMAERREAAWSTRLRDMEEQGISPGGGRDPTRTGTSARVAARLDALKQLVVPLRQRAGVIGVGPGAIAAHCIAPDVMPGLLRDRRATCVAFSPDHARLAVGFSTSADGTDTYEDQTGVSAAYWCGLILVWSTQDWSEPRSVLVVGSTPCSLVFSPGDGGVLFAGTDSGGVDAWDLRESAAMHAPLELAPSVAGSDDARRKGRGPPDAHSIVWAECRRSQVDCDVRRPCLSTNLALDRVRSDAHSASVEIGRGVKSGGGPASLDARWGGHRSAVLQILLSDTGEQQGSSKAPDAGTAGSVAAQLGSRGHGQTDPSGTFSISSCDEQGCIITWRVSTHASAERYAAGVVSAGDDFEAHSRAVGGLVSIARVGALDALRCLPRPLPGAPLGLPAHHDAIRRKALEDQQRAADEALSDRDVGVVDGFGRAARSGRGDSQESGKGQENAPDRLDDFDFGEGDDRGRGQDAPVAVGLPSNGAKSVTDAELLVFGSNAPGHTDGMQEIALPSTLPTDREIVLGSASTALSVVGDLWTVGRRITGFAALHNGSGFVVAGTDGRVPVVLRSGKAHPLRSLVPDLADAPDGSETKLDTSVASDISSTTASLSHFIGPCSVLAPVTSVAVNPFDGDIVAVGREDGSVSVYDLGSGSAFPLRTWDAVAPTMSSGSKPPSERAAAAAIFRSIAAVAWSTIRPGGLFALGDSGTLAAFELSLETAGPIVRENAADSARPIFTRKSQAGARAASDAPRAVALSLNGGGGRPAGRLYIAVLFASAKGLKGAVGNSAVDATEGSPSAVAVLELDGAWAMQDTTSDGLPLSTDAGVHALRRSLGVMGELVA